MATTGKKKKKKGMTKSDKYVLIGLIVFAIAVGSYVLATWDWPSRDPADLIGTWVKDASNVAVDQGTNYSQATAQTWTFGTDGTLTVENPSGQTGTGAYSVDGRTLTLTFGAESESMAFVVRGNKLTLGAGDDSFSLTKAK